MILYVSRTTMHTDIISFPMCTYKFNDSHSFQRTFEFHKGWTDISFGCGNIHSVLLVATSAIHSRRWAVIHGLQRVFLKYKSRLRQLHWISGEGMHICWTGIDPEGTQFSIIHKLYPFGRLYAGTPKSPRSSFFTPFHRMLGNTISWLHLWEARTKICSIFRFFGSHRDRRASELRCNIR